ncbi:MAG: hypothetical protein ACRD3N_03790, partial [Terracidiphilus sp.]
QAPDRRPIQSWRRLHISAAKSFHHAALHAALEHGDLNHRLLSTLSEGGGVGVAQIAPFFQCIVIVSHMQ